MKMSKNERWSASFIRIGNKAVREAQAQNRELGILNWYSLNGRIVNDAVQQETEKNNYKSEEKHE